MLLVLSFLSLLVLVGAVVSDARYRRIPNSLIVLGWIVGFAWHHWAQKGAWTFDSVSPGATGFAGWFVGAVSLLLAFLPLYALRIMGAGDVKLMSVVGGFFGATTDAWTQLPGVALMVLASGGLLSIGRMLISGKSAAVLANLKLIFYSFLLRRSGGAAPVFDPRTDSADRMPYAVAIALGTILYVVGKWTGWITLL